MNLPGALIVVAVLYMLAGVSAIWNVLSGFAHHQINLNLGILCLPAGVGLLRLSRGWRTVALVFLWIPILVLVVIFFMLLTNPAKVNVKEFGISTTAAESPTLAWTLLVVVSAFFWWVYHVLTREDVRRLFGIGGTPPDDGDQGE